MVINMNTSNTYLLITNDTANNTQVVTNLLVLDSDSNYQLQENEILLEYSKTLSNVWTYDSNTGWTMFKTMGHGNIGDVWDGNGLTSPEPNHTPEKPVSANTQSKTTGTQTI